MSTTGLERLNRGAAHRPRRALDRLGDVETMTVQRCIEIYGSGKDNVGNPIVEAVSMAREPR
jgi:hypothetical protein